MFKATNEDCGGDAEQTDTEHRDAQAVEFSDEHVQDAPNDGRAAEYVADGGAVQATAVSDDVERDVQATAVSEEIQKDVCDVQANTADGGDVQAVEVGSEVQDTMDLRI